MYNNRNFYLHLPINVYCIIVFIGFSEPCVLIAWIRKVVPNHILHTGWDSDTISFSQVSILEKREHLVEVKASCVVVNNLTRAFIDQDHDCWAIDGNRNCLIKHLTGLFQQVIGMECHRTLGILERPHHQPQMPLLRSPFRSLHCLGRNLCFIANDSIEESSLKSWTE